MNQPPANRTPAVSPPKTRTSLPQLVAVPRLSAMGLQDWSPAEPLPAGLTKDRLSKELAIASHSLEPALPMHRASFEVLMGDFFAAQSMRLDPKLEEAYWRQVWAVIADLPPDLLRLAAERLWNWRWPTRPKPGDYRAAVSDEMTERSITRAKLATAVRFGHEQPKPGKRDPETVARVADLVAGLKRRRTNDPTEPTDADLEQRRAAFLASMNTTGAAAE